MSAFAILENLLNTQDASKADRFTEGLEKGQSPDYILFWLHQDRINRHPVYATRGLEFMGQNAYRK
jgi:hypothetical protein